ncbi:MAG: fimbrillin family protein [Muribaculaceae bacterium]|nr:fimbrillin family protein [Muribaculaceae bacterium]
MKKSLFLVAIAATALASCTSDELVQVNNGNEIKFAIAADNDSRAATVFCNANLMPGFQVYAGYQNEGAWSTFIEEDLITVLSDGKCTQSETRYWPEKGTLDFYGLVNLNGDGYTLESASNLDDQITWGVETPVVNDFTPNADVTKQTDLLYAVATGKSSSSAPVMMNFRHALSQIEFRAKNDNPALQVFVSAVRIGQTYAKGSYTLPKLSTEENLVDHTVDKDDDYAAAHENANRGTWAVNTNEKADYYVPFNEVSVAYGTTQDLTISTDGAQTNNNSLLLIPAMEAGSATTAWDPASDNNTAYNGTYIAVYCKILNVAGDSYDANTDVAVLHEGWAVIPASFKWKQGKKYIYTINFTKGGNGGYEETPVDPSKPEVPGTPTDTPVLTGIEFQVTVDDFLYGDKYENDMDTNSTETVAINSANFLSKIAQGGSFILDEDVNLGDNSAVFTKDSKLNLNGHTVKGGKAYVAGQTTGADISALVVDNGATLTITGEGAVEGNTYGVYAKKGTLNIEGGKYSAETSAVQVAEATVNISGGEFSNTASDKRYTINCIDANWKNGTAKVNITGGKYTDFNPANNAAEGAGTNFVADGYQAAETAAGVWEVVPEGKEYVANNEELKAALTQDEEFIIVELSNDVTYDVAAWANDAMGGASTKTITINANDNTITFNNTNSDWNNIVTANNAKLIINNAKITNAGYNDGPWNRHDLNFACDVEMNNVVSDKAMAFKAGATLNNVTINDPNTSDTYAIWVQPKGQTVTLNNCTIDMAACSDGRGLKIDNQYLAAAEEGKVTLNVAGTKFITEEKSAVLVKSTVGAIVNWGAGNDIAEVAADNVNAVWVDEAAAAYADLVTVTGATKIVEP